jgi:hypothetical protein
MSDGHHRRLKNERSSTHEKILLNHLHPHSDLRWDIPGWLRDNPVRRCERATAAEFSPFAR